MGAALWALAAAAMIAGCTAQPSGEAREQAVAAPACDFDCTLERHLRAIADHDFAAFAPTITARPDIQLVLPDGSIIAGREPYMEALQSFLDEGGFAFNYETVDKRAGTDLGYALIDVTQVNDGADAPSRYYLLLVFAIEDGEWRLVHDQNTRIETPEAGE